MTESQGIPLQVLLQHFHDNDLVVDWASYIDDAVQLGWSIETVLAKAEEAIQDVLGKKVAEQIIYRMKTHILSR